MILYANEYCSFPCQAFRDAYHKQISHKVISNLLASIPFYILNGKSNILNGNSNKLNGNSDKLNWSSNKLHENIILTIILIIFQKNFIYIIVTSYN